MPRDASGIYTRTNGNFSGTTTWAQQAASADKVIRSGQHDTHDQDIGNEMTNSLDRTGKGAMQSNLDMGGNKVTSLGDGTVASDAATFGQLSGFPGVDTINRFTQQQQWNVGTEIASAATLAIPDDGNAFKVTGAVTITAFSTKPVGTWIWLEFDDVLTLTHGINLVLNNNGDDIVTAAGDRAICIQGTASAWTVWVMRASGEAINTGPAAVLSEAFVSGVRTITAASLDSFAHGLTAAPTLITTKLVCTAVGGSLGYSQNDEVFFANVDVSSSFTAYRGVQARADGTNIELVYGQDGVHLMSRDAPIGQIVIAPLTDWGCKVYAWR